MINALDLVAPLTPALLGLAFGIVVAYVIWISYPKDAPWVPLKPEVVDRVMKIASIGSEDIFYDLGSGDGRLVIAAALRGAKKSVGVEIDPLRVFYSNFWIRLLGINHKAKIIKANLFDTNISEATVVNTYLLPDTHQLLKKKITKECKPGTKIIAEGFEYRNWKFSKIDQRGPIFGPIRLYLV